MSKASDEETPVNFGLSDQDRNNIVVSFIKAYLDGKVKVTFPTADEIREDSEYQDALGRKYGVDMTQWTASDLQLAAQNEFRTRFRMAAGSSTISTEERRKAINSLFDLIPILREGNKLEGEFIGVATLESKLAGLEERVDGLDELLKELRLYMRALLGNGGAASQ